MNFVRIAAAICGAALLFGATASAQNLSLRAPPWALPLVGTDITPTTGGRAIISEEGIDVAVRVTIQPMLGGVARVIRYEQRGDNAQLFVRRFTGHPVTGWWLWGSDGPRITTPAVAQRAEVATLARAAMSVATLGGGDAGDTCTQGEQAFVEVAVGGRSASFIRNCVSATDPIGHLTSRLSDIAGSRDDEEFHTAALQELLDADRAFAAKAHADGVPAAFAAYAADNAIMLSGDHENVSGHDAIVARFANWPAGAHIEWAPEAGRVSDRGDMGWTWGNATHIAADGTRTTGRYVSIWTRDLDGNWKYAVDAGVN